MKEGKGRVLGRHLLQTAGQDLGRCFQAEDTSWMKGLGGAGQSGQRDQAWKQVRWAQAGAGTITKPLALGFRVIQGW